MTSRNLTTETNEINHTSDSPAWLDYFQWPPAVPLTGFIDGNHEFEKGIWRMILYHEDCPKCQQLIRDAVSATQDTPTVFVEVPPFKSPPRPDRDDLLWRKLTSKHMSDLLRHRT